MTTPGAHARVPLGDDIRTLEDLCFSNTELVMYMKSMTNREYIILYFILCLV